MERLEAVFEVLKSRLGVSDNGGFFGEIESALGIIVVLGARADDICV